jgi:hypothetical protein
VPPGGWLVLCSAADRSALWVYERLRARGRAPVGLLLVDSLASDAVRWEHRVGTAGSSLTLTTADGRTVRSPDLGAVLNRVAGPPLGMLAAADPADRDYARNELSAFAAGWLRSLSANVVNAPDPHGLCGRWRTPLQWRVLAARCGMACAPLRLASDQEEADAQLPNMSTTVLAIDGHILADAAPARLQRACAQLTTLAGARILGLRFDGADPAAGGWQLLDATTYPDLSFAGECGVAAIENALAT